MDVYHEEGINPGEHKIFSIDPSIHSFSDDPQIVLAMNDRPPGKPTIESIPLGQEKNEKGAFTVPVPLLRSPNYSTLRRTEGAGDVLKGKAYPQDFETSVKAMLDMGIHPRDIAKELGVREYSVRDYMGKNRLKIGEKLKDEVPDWFIDEMKQ